jgi:imidazolonepropionase-like amidohydrolase
MLDRVGTLEVGRIADLLLLDADPLQGTRNTRSIRGVIRHGRIVR